MTVLAMRILQLDNHLHVGQTTFHVFLGQCSNFYLVKNTNFNLVTYSLLRWPMSPFLAGTCVNISMIGAQSGTYGASGPHSKRHERSMWNDSGDRRGEEEIISRVSCKHMFCFVKILTKNAKNDLHQGQVQLSQLLLR